MVCRFFVRTIRLGASPASVFGRIRIGTASAIALGISLSILLTPATSHAQGPGGAQPSGAELHEQLFLENRFPSANTCAQCHVKQYREWSVSSHAYAQLSPMLTAFQNALNKKNSSTAGDFCLRCHAPTGTALGEPTSMSNLERSAASREGITCVSCHRVSQSFGKVTGRYPIVEGDIFDPVYGIDDGSRFQEAQAQPQKYRMHSNRGESGRAVHGEVKAFSGLSSARFCNTCHEVTSQGGFRTHEMMVEFKRSPAAKRGVTCVDCHMGTVEGKESPREIGPAAVVGGVPTPDRPLARHLFAGPDYSIIHPGIFPHNVEATKLKTLQEWSRFDHKAGWGTDEFEDVVNDDYPFPAAWISADDRYDARAILDDQFELLGWAAEKRVEVLQNGFGVSQINVKRTSPARGLNFSLEVSNITDGHYTPSGFDIERTVFMQVTVTDSAGNIVFQSGDRDPNGDLRDSHSRYVAAKLLPHDDSLFNLHSKTYVGIVRGPERAQILAPPVSRNALPMVRPDPRPTMLYGRNRNTRKHRGGIPPGQSRTAAYRVPADKLRPGQTYTIEARLMFQPLPISLIYEIQSVGFDYDMSPKEVADRLVKDTTEIWRRKATVRYGANGIETALHEQDAKSIRGTKSIQTAQRGE